MGHMLAKLKGVPCSTIRGVLEADAPQHAKEGLFLEHLWLNTADPTEVLFLFRVDDLAHAEEFIERVHREALAKDPTVNLPQMTYLKGEPPSGPR